MYNVIVERYVPNSIIMIVKMKGALILSQYA